MSASATATARSYVVIDLDAYGNVNKAPFKNALAPPKEKAGRKPKTLFGTFLYAFRATVDGTTYWKIGETYDPASYHSKKRFCPMIEYSGVLQILHFGRPLEMLVHAYLDSAVGRSYKGSEWYAAAGPALEALVAAMRANPAYLEETPHVMVGVDNDYPVAFTCGAGAKTVEPYLSLFRVTHRGRRYRLCAANLSLPIRLMAAPDYLDEPPTPRADAPAPAAPAAPAARTSLSASVVLDGSDSDAAEASTSSESSE